MKEDAEGKDLFTKDRLAYHGSKVTFFEGVEEWFERIRKYGEENNVIVEHYIISSGLKEMIEGTSIAKAGVFERIYASSFYYNSKGVAVWPAQAINYTNKTQFLFRIEKGVLDINDPGVNEYFAPEDIRVPFRNIIYIGDSETDVPCMKLVNTYGGHSIGVYNNDTLDKSKVYKMLSDNRIKYFAPADYREGSEIDALVKAIIDRTSKNEILENIHYKCKKEREENDLSKHADEIKRQKIKLILALYSSMSFATTHSIINKLLSIDSWTDDEIDMLFDVALTNSQVFYILNDSDVKLFYNSIIKQTTEYNEKAEKIKKELK